jgi:hypothetical protein
MNAPETREAAPQQGKAAPFTKSQAQSTDSNDRLQQGKTDQPSPNIVKQGAHVAIEAAALTHGRLCLAGAMEHGFVGPLDIEADVFHADLTSAARFARSAWSNGISGWMDVLLHLVQETSSGPAQDALRMSIADIAQEVPHYPSKLANSAEIVTKYHCERRKQHLLWQIQKASETGEPIDKFARALAKLCDDPDKADESLRERAYAMRFDPNETPPPDETCMVIGDIPIAARGNLTVPQGKSKVGKSAMISAILGAANRGNLSATGDTLCVAWQGESTGAIVHMDTEQSRADWHSLVCRGITRSGMSGPSPRLVSLPMVMFSRGERLTILRQTLEFERRDKGGIDLVVIDGVADLCVSPNDEAEALELVSKLHAMAQEFHCPMFCVLHENPGSEQGKTRGHLGSELNRKAFANLRIDKDAESSVSTIYGSDMRKREIPKEQGFCFAWDDLAKMHTFQGRAAGIKAAQAEEKATSKSRAEWEAIFEFAAGIGTNLVCPELSPNLAAQAERDISGTKKLTTEPTMKKRMQRAESLGVLRKASIGKWTLNPSGHSGHDRDKS